MRSPKRHLGVDLGATWLRVCLTDGTDILSETRLPAVSWRQTPRVLQRILRAGGVKRVDAITLGGTRLGAAASRAELRKSLRALARSVRVCPDYEIAHRAAFGSGPGVLLIASTGSLAFARGVDGKSRRAGGLGPLLGDEGSGFWLGKTAARDAVLRSALRLPDPLSLAHAADPVRATAALAPRVLNARLTRARRLREDAADHLAALAVAAAKGLRLPVPVPLSLHGSLFKNRALKTAVVRRLGRVREVEPRVSAERAAAGL
ncbi:MAG: BadF/BadG/BcrA/BcrD ATPase family protein [Elusimicrobiota bacterium]